MKTHDQKTKDHIKAICDTFAEEPERVSYKEYNGGVSLRELHDHPFSYSIKPKPLAPGHNPDGLTVEQVGGGWRLLEKDELSTFRSCIPDIDAWAGGKWTGTSNGGTQLQYCYRTRLSRDQLALLDKNEGWIPWFGEGEIPTGNLDAAFNGNAFEYNKPTELWAEAWPVNNWTTKRTEGRIIAYRPAKQPTVVPWDCADDVPATCWLRSKGERQWMALVVMVNGSRVSFASESATAIASRTYEQLSAYEHSTDRINWFPCNKKSGVKGEK